MRIHRLAVETKEQALISSDDTIDLSLLDPLIRQYKKKKGNLIPLLQGTQNIYSYIPAEAFIKLSSETGHSLSEMYGVATFYSQFRLTPVGKHIIKVCHGTACHVQGAEKITEALEDALNVKDGETTDDGLFTLESVACLGCCSLAPVMMIGEETYGKLDGKSTVKVIREIKKLEKTTEKDGKA
jgi:NADH-quinone oxidoreductase subunit E